jgi:hypothetical protein
MSYAELALGIKDKFCEEEIETAVNFLTPHYLETEETNFEKDLDDWKIIYFHLLKIYEHFLIHLVIYLNLLSLFFLSWFQMKNYLD